MNATYYAVEFYVDGLLDHNGIMTADQAALIASGRTVRFGKTYSWDDIKWMTLEERGL